MTYGNKRVIESTNVNNTQRSDDGFIISVVFFVSVVLVALVFSYLTFQNPAWQLFGLTGVAIALASFAAYSLRLNKQQRRAEGIKWLLGATYGAMIIVSCLVTNLGVTVGFMGLLITLIIAAQTLSQREVNRVLLFSVSAAFISSLAEFVPLYTHLDIPQIRPIILVAASGLLLCYVVFMVYRFDVFPLHAKLILTFLTASIIPLILLVFINMSTEKTLTDAANEKLFSRASETASSIDAFINDTLNTIRAEAQLPEIVAFLSTPVEQRQQGNYHRETLETLSSKDKNILTYGILNFEGRNVSDSEQLFLSQDESAHDYFKIPLETGESYVSPVLIEQNGRAIMYFSTPILNRLREIVGVLRVRYDAAILEELVGRNSSQLVGGSSVATIGQNTGSEPNVFAILVDENLIRLVDIAEPNLVFKSVVPLDPTRMAELQAARRLPDLPPDQLSTNLPSFEQGLLNAGEQLYFTGIAHPQSELEQGAIAQLATQSGWSVVFVQPQSTFLGPIEAQTRIVLIFALGIGVVAIVAAILVSQRLANPLTELTAIAQRAAEGELSIKAPVTSQDEIGQLATVFNSMTEQLLYVIGSLESQVKERTNDLLLSMEVGQRAAAIRNLDELLPIITEFIRQQFRLYYVHVYLLDDTQQKLVIRAGTGTVGEALMSRRHSLPVGLGSIVGRVAADKQPIVVSDTSTSDIHKPNPLLPDTRSELAVPLIVEDQVIGVLDMQSNQVDTFTQESLTVFEAMATQLANSIDGARQWALAQEAQQRLETANRQLTHNVWVNRLAKRETELGFTYDLSSINALNDKKMNGDFSIPVVIQNEVIGQFSIQTDDRETLSSDEQALLVAVAQQLAQKAENIRLFEQTQQRAARERLARQITDKIRTSRDIETALKTAAEELSKALGTAKAVVDLRIDPETNHKDEADTT